MTICICENLRIAQFEVPVHLPHGYFKQRGVSKTVLVQRNYQRQEKETKKNLSQYQEDQVCILHDSLR